MSVPLLAMGEESIAATPAGTAILADPVYKQHDPGAGHPERPERYDAVTQALSAAGLMNPAARIKPRFATEDEIALCHSHAYIQKVKQEIGAGARQLSTGDTDVGPRSFEVALEAAGGILNAVDAVIERKARNAFCVVRPPGHHARPEQGMGFCIFNSIAIAARYAQRKHGLGKVLIADWDVHHGNGTQDIFYSDGSVLFFSTHQSPWYPGTGAAGETGDGKGKNCTINVPLPAGSGRSEIVGSFRQRLMPAAEGFRPDLVLISAGFDSRIDDPLGRFRLSDDDFAELTAIMLEIAGLHAGSRLVSVLEGGYNLSGLASGATAHVKALAHV
ncbi:MAG TPA: histone deacetylase [Bryobacteraceae bacterium]|nr:histone deacetylase [Bryobacteraceae bacterium]